MRGEVEETEDKEEEEEDEEGREEDEEDHNPVIIRWEAAGVGAAQGALRRCQPSPWKPSQTRRQEI